MAPDPVIFDLTDAYVIIEGGTIVIGRSEGAFSLEYTDIADLMTTENGVRFYADAYADGLFRSSITLSLSSRRGKAILEFSAMHDGIFTLTPLNCRSVSLKRNENGRDIDLTFSGNDSFTLSLGKNVRYDSGAITVRAGASALTVALEGGDLVLKKKRKAAGFVFSAEKCAEALYAGGLDITGRLAPYLILPSLLAERKLDRQRLRRLTDGLELHAETDKGKAERALDIYCRAFGEETPI